MPFGIDPEVLLLVGIVGGVGAVGTYTAFHYAEQVGTKLEAGDLLPMPPPYPPVPRFVYTKPELVETLRSSVMKKGGNNA